MPEQINEHPTTVEISPQPEPTEDERKLVNDWIEIFEKEVEGSIWNTAAEALDYKSGIRQDEGPHKSSGLFLNNTYPYQGIVSVTNAGRLTEQFTGFNPLEILWVSIPKPTLQNSGTAELGLFKLIMDPVGRPSAVSGAFKLPQNLIGKLITDIQDDPDLLPAIIDNFAARNENVRGSFVYGSMGRKSQSYSPSAIFLIPFDPTQIQSVRDYDAKRQEFKKGFEQARIPDNKLSFKLTGNYPNLGNIQEQ